MSKDRLVNYQEPTAAYGTTTYGNNYGTTTYGQSGLGQTLTTGPVNTYETTSYANPAMGTTTQGVHTSSTAAPRVSFSRGNTASVYTTFDVELALVLLFFILTLAMFLLPLLLHLLLLLKSLPELKL